MRRSHSSLAPLLAGAVERKYIECGGLSARWLQVSARRSGAAPRSRCRGPLSSLASGRLSSGSCKEPWMHFRVCRGDRQQGATDRSSDLTIPSRRDAVTLLGGGHRRLIGPLPRTAQRGSHSVWVWEFSAGPTAASFAARVRHWTEPAVGCVVGGCASFAVVARSAVMRWLPTRRAISQLSRLARRMKRSRAFWWPNVWGR